MTSLPPPVKTRSLWHSTSQSVTDTVNGSHNFTIKGYSLAKGMGIGQHIASDNFIIGGYQWAIYFYPDGKNPEDNASYVSVFIAPASEGADLRALFELTLVDQSGNGKDKVHSHFDCSLETGPYSLKYRGSMWGYKLFFRRALLETSDYLKDDCLKINVQDCILFRYQILILDQILGLYWKICRVLMLFLMWLVRNFMLINLYWLLDLLCFSLNFLIDWTVICRRPLLGLYWKIFKVMLHFIYRDALVEDELVACSSYSSSSVSDTLMAKLLVTADKYDLLRLRRICESYLCKDVSVNSVAETIALADQYHATELKAICLRFAAENLAGRTFLWF